ncbi:hypothetical protein AGMMS49525_00130 [Bacteroidia bacterium]|nr:hypothetical protein AGMMS49525_00130 [Bacteroidia bacterium]
MARQIIFAPVVKLYLEDLSVLLFEQGYFGFQESAQVYVDGIIDFMIENIGIRPGRVAPP